MLGTTLYTSLENPTWFLDYHDMSLSHSRRDNFSRNVFNFTEINALLRKVRKKINAHGVSQIIPRTATNSAWYV